MTYSPRHSLQREVVANNKIFQKAPICQVLLPRNLGAKPSFETGERFLRMPELVSRLGISKATIYRRIQEGVLPKPVKLSKRCVAWKESTLLEWFVSLEPAY